MSTKTYTVRYQLEGVDRVVKDTKSIVYLLNAVRLSVKDIQLVLDPSTRSIQNIFWTAIQLTRTWTHFYRLVKAVSKEQDIILAKSLAIRASTVGVPIGQARFGPGGTLITPTPGMVSRAWGSITGFAGAHPYAAAAIAGVGIGVALYGAYYWQTEQAKKAWRERQRETAVRQGIEP